MRLQPTQRNQHERANSKIWRIVVLVWYSGRLSGVETDTTSIYCCCHEASTGVIRASQSFQYRERERERVWTNALFYCCDQSPREFHGNGHITGFGLWADIVEKYVSCSAMLHVAVALERTRVDPVVFTRRGTHTVYCHTSKTGACSSSSSATVRLCWRPSQKALKAWMSDVPAGRMMRVGVRIRQGVRFRTPLVLVFGCSLPETFHSQRQTFVRMAAPSSVFERVPS